MSNSLYLSPIELAVLAELNLELARDHEQVADDLNNQDETRRTARRIATERRARARTLQAEVNRLSGQPLTDDDQLISDSRPAYVGPERRKANRRVRERRRGPSRPLEAPGLIERRSSLDQRRGERRRPPVARS